MAYIYKVINNINGKIYIGQTRYTVEWRWHTHLYATFNETCGDYNSPLHKAIRKYGIENFSVDVVEVCKADELNNKEQEWIRKCNSLVTQNGYNISLSGGYKKYDETDVLRLWNDGYSASEIARLSPGKMGRNTARLILLGAGISNEQIRKRGNEAIARSKEKIVYQYDIRSGDFIKSFYSCSLAAKETKATKTNINAAANGNIKSAGGYLWSYEKKDKLEVSPQVKGTKFIARCNENGKITAVYTSATMAAKHNGISRKKITILCETERPFKGCTWKYLFIKDGVIFDESNL